MWTARPTERVWRSCRPPFSFYHYLIQRYWASGVGETEAAPLHRLCTLSRKMGVRSILIEDAFARPDVKAELKHLEPAADMAEGVVEAFTVSFLTSGPPRPGRPTALGPEQVIGQATIITFPTPDGRKSYLFEALFRVPRSQRRELLLNNYIPLQRDLDVVVGGRAHVLPCAVFAQQNGVTSVCAHTAVRTLLRTSKGLEVSVAELNGLWAYDAVGRKVATEEFAGVFAHYGLRAVAYDFEDKKAPADGSTREEYTWRTLAGILESGSPAVLVIETAGASDHVISLVGFTLNTDEWHPHAAPTFLSGRDRHESSSAWIDHLVIHDEALGPYYCLARAGLFEPGKGRATIKPRMGIAVLPDDVVVSPPEAESFAKEALDRAIKMVASVGEGRGRWWKLLAHPNHRRVIRATLVAKQTYMVSLRGLPKGDDPEAKRLLNELEANLPDRFWLCEVTLPQLFVGNRAKLGDLLLRVDLRANKEGETLIGCRFPGALAWREDETMFSVVSFPDSGHSPLLASYHANAW